jgi:hypothetical protein
MVGGPGLRFALEAAFLIVLAVAAGLAELSPTTIVLVMAGAWLLVAAIEWLAWRESPVLTRVVRAEPPAAASEEAGAPAPGSRRRLRFWRRREPVEPEPVAGEDTQDFAPPPAEPTAARADERTGT